MDAIPTSCSSKRKTSVDAEDVGSKRLKTDLESEKTRENGRLVRSPWICVDPERLQQPVTMEELLKLLHYATLGKTRGVEKPSWCRLHKQRMVKAVSVAVVEDVTQRDFYEHCLSLPNLRTKYNTRVTLSSSSKNLVSEIFSSEVTVVHTPAPPVPQKQQKDCLLQKAVTGHPVITKFGTERRGLTAYLLSADEMNKHNYPLTGRPGCEGFVCTDSDPVVTNSSPLYGLDCEMCLTDQGNELTRVSLVDSTGTCVLDQLVKPRNQIRNYLTKFSGVTARMLKPVQTTLSDVQTKLRSLLPRDAVLVGHSLENDLMALKMVHPHVIDTSLLYRRQFGQRFKLKVLAETLLQKQIQREEKKGHDPSEDAAAALELAQYFITTGPLKIVEDHLEELWGFTLKEEDTTQQVPAPQPPTKFADLLQFCGRSVAFLGRRSAIALDLSKQLWFTSDRQVLDSFRAQTKCPFFSVLQFFSGQKFGAHVQVRTQTCSPLRDMCAVYAGPLPPEFSEKDVRRLFCCCGPLHSVRIIHTGLRVHAEVQYELLESALLSVTTLNGLRVQGQSIKVQRPVNESTLDLDVTLDSLKTDPLNSRLLYVVKVRPDVTERLHTSTKTKGYTLDPIGVTDCTTPVQVNGLKTHELTQETLLDTFSRFGPVHRIITPSNTGGYLTHFYIQFQSADSRQAALSSSEDLLNQDYLVCPAFTPLHLSLWRTMDTPVDTPVDTERTRATEKGERRHSPVMGQKLRKLDRHLGKLFRCLPDGTLSVVILRAGDNSPGLCFLEIKQGS